MSFAAPARAPTILLRVFGSPALVAHDEAGAQSILLPAGKPLLILSYLACHPEAWTTRDQLANLAWGDSDEQSAKASLRQALYRLRQLLGSEWVETSDSGVRLAAPLQSDWQAATEAMRLGNDGGLLQLVSGSFLAGLDENDQDDLGTWLGAERSRWDHLVRDAALREGRKALSVGRIEGGIAFAERAIRARDDQLESWEVLLDGLQATGISSRVDDGLARLEISGTRGGMSQLGPAGWRALVKRIHQTAPREHPKDPPVGALTRGNLPLVGRDPLLRHVRETLGAPVDTFGRVAVVQGAPGFGKSRFLREYRVRDGGAGRRDMLVAARSTESATQWALLIRIVETLAGFPEASGIDPTAAMRLVALHPALRERFPGSRERSHAIATPQEVASAFCELLDAVGETEPLLIMIDDAQWCDDASLGVLRDTIDRTGTGRLACLITTRDATLLRAPRWPVIQLASLGVDDLEVLLADQIPLLGASQLATAAASLMLVTGGVPIYLARAIQRVTQHSASVLTADQILSGLASLELHRDPTFPTAMADRLLLGYLATADGPVVLAELQAFQGQANGEPVTLRLEQMQASGWVTLSEEGASLSHDLVRRQVIEAITPIERRNLALLHSRWLVDHGSDFRSLQTAVRLYLNHKEEGLAARAVDRWRRRVQTGPRGDALASLVLPPDAPRLLRWRIAASTTPTLMPWLVAVAVLLALGSWGALQWLAQPASLRLENKPIVEGVSIHPGARVRTNAIFPIFSVRDRLGKVSEALDGSALYVTGWSPSVDSAMLTHQVIVTNGLAIVSGLEVYAAQQDSETVTFRVGRVQPLAVTVARGFEYTRLTIDGGLINGIEVAREQPEVIVAPGDSLIGLVRLRYNTPTHAALWMLAETSTMRPAMEDTTTVITLHVGASNAMTEVIVQRQAPMEPGEYWLVWSFAAQPDAVSIFSLTNWRCPAPHWNDGNDLLSVGDSGLRTVWGGGHLAVNSDLCEPNKAPRREHGGLIPTAAMRVVVR